MSDGLRVCLLLESESVPAWQARAVERLVSETDVAVTLTVVNEAESRRSIGDAVRRARELREWAPVAGAIALRRRLVGPPPQQRRVSIDRIEAVRTAERRRCTPHVEDGWKRRLPEDVVDGIAASADVAIRFGFGFLVGRALTAPEHGVLSFHHGDLRAYRGQPMGFWEFVHGRETAGVTLQRINETLDGGEIVASTHVDIGDADRWGTVKARQLAASGRLLVEGVRNVADDDVEPETPAELGELYSLPRGRPVLTYVHKTVRGAVRSALPLDGDPGETPSRSGAD